MKHLVISVGLFLVSSLASANLVQHTITQTAHQQSKRLIAASSSSGYVFSPLADMQSSHQKPSKAEAIYSTLFEYSSHINQAIDHRGLSVFWNHSLISSAIDATHSQQHWASAHINDNSDLSSFIANSLNDDYMAANNTGDHINEVPVPAAIWLFASAVMLFGFARRSTV